MLTEFIIAVGGTGQVVLRYYVMLHLGGVIKEPFHAVIVDTDTLNRGLEIAKDFFQWLRVGAEAHNGLGGDIPTLEFVRVETEGSNRVSQALTGQLCADLPRDDPIRALFDLKALSQDIGRGLFGIPALSSVLTGNWLKEENLHLPGPQAPDATGAVVASLIGGTGGGLLTPLVDQVLAAIKNKQTQMKLRGVLFGEYFTADTAIVPREVHQSNLKMTSRSLEEIKGALDYFTVIGNTAQERMGDRRHQQEKAGRPIWPDKDTHPHWLGVRALFHLLKEHTAQQTPEFTDREIETDELDGGRVNLDTARTRIEEALGRANALAGKQPVTRMAADPLAAVVWGRALTGLLEGPWEVAADRLGRDAEVVKGFPHRVQEKIRHFWEGENGLEKIFPDTLEPQRTQPMALKRAGWPRFDRTRLDMELFGGQESAVLRPAATLLFTALRG